ncbi:MAG: hypothetical protein F4X58_06545 [Chloroflexi bacterium]|nr:hypothetical protein [Chloroflexota bacterium]MYC01562.1 hypothetical protein [Chloroflexota bacterium]
MPDTTTSVIAVFSISVNNKPVELKAQLPSGLEIKEAAIEQGVAIKLDFQLARVDLDGKQQIVGNTDKVDVLEFKTFFATAGDDNS